MGSSGGADVVDTVRRLVSSPQHARVELGRALEPNDGWTPTCEFRAQVTDAIAALSLEFGVPTFRGPGPSCGGSKDLKPAPDDYSRVCEICAWRSGERVVYLTVTTHDADTLRCLNLEVFPGESADGG